MSSSDGSVYRALLKSSTVDSSCVLNIETEFNTGTFSLAVVKIVDMAKLLAEVKTSQGKDVAKVYRTPNEDYKYEIRTVDTPSEPDRIHGGMAETRESIRSNTSEFLASINHPDSGSDLRVYLV
ncbi:hypothetical protein ACFQH6_19425 [Halobacteriaceae archaeon GCM10025711]